MSPATWSGVTSCVTGSLCDQSRRFPLKIGTVAISCNSSYLSSGFAPSSSGSSFLMKSNLPRLQACWSMDHVAWNEFDIAHRSRLWAVRLGHYPDSANCKMFGASVTHVVSKSTMTVFFIRFSSSCNVFEGRDSSLRQDHGPFSSQVQASNCLCQSCDHRSQ